MEPAVVKIGPFGCDDSSSSENFDQYLPFGRIRYLIIRYGGGIDSIHAVYVKPDGSFERLDKVGGAGGVRTAYVDLLGERIAEIYGHYGRFWDGRPIVMSLTLVTESKKKYGPYGTEKGSAFGFKLSGAEVIGLFGNHAKYVSSIGFYVRNLKEAKIAANSVGAAAAETGGAHAVEAREGYVATAHPAGSSTSLTKLPLLKSDEENRRERMRSRVNRLINDFSPLDFPSV